MTTLYISSCGSYISNEDSEQDRYEFFAQHDDVHKVEMPDNIEQDMDEFVDEFIRNLRY